MSAAETGPHIAAAIAIAAVLHRSCFRTIYPLITHRNKLDRSVSHSGFSL
jgi:hypothetical protein